MRDRRIPSEARQLLGLALGCAQLAQVSDDRLDLLRPQASFFFSPCRHAPARHGLMDGGGKELIRNQSQKIRIANREEGSGGIPGAEPAAASICSMTADAEGSKTLAPSGQTHVLRNGTMRVRSFGR